MNTTKRAEQFVSLSNQRQLDRIAVEIAFTLKENKTTTTTKNCPHVLAMLSRQYAFLALDNAVVTAMHVDRTGQMLLYLAAKFYFGKQFDCRKMLINIIIIAIIMTMDDYGDDNAHTAWHT